MPAGRQALGFAAVIVLMAAWPAATEFGAPAAAGTPELSPGQVTLARLRWGADGRMSRRGGFSSAWNHDYPRAEQHLSMIAKELTFTNMRTDADVIVTLDDPALFTYPIALMWEPGFWNLTDAEAEWFRLIYGLTH